MSEEKSINQSGADREEFYAKVLDKAEKLDFTTALEDNSLDSEIALLKIKIKELVEKDPENLKLFLQAADMLGRLMRTRYTITREQKKGLKDALQNVIKDIAVPLGIAVINKKL